jgi:hypothetical protein
MGDFLKRRKAGCSSNYFGVNDNYMLLNGAMSSPPSTSQPASTTGGARKPKKPSLKSKPSYKSRRGGNVFDNALNTAFQPLADLGRNNGGGLKRRNLRRGGNFVSDLINATSASASTSPAPPPVPPPVPSPVSASVLPPAPVETPVTATGGGNRRKMRKGGNLDLAPFLTSVALFSARMINDENLMNELKGTLFNSKSPVKSAKSVKSAKTAKSTTKKSTTKKSKQSKRSLFD